MYEQTTSMDDRAPRRKIRGRPQNLVSSTQFPVFFLGALFCSDSAGVVGTVTGIGPRLAVGNAVFRE